MTDRNPPRLASWLLDKLGYLRQNGLGGDLLEEFHSGRSRAWFWRQTAVVIATGFRLNASGPLRVFAVLFAIQALLDCSLWRFRGQAEMGNYDLPGLLSAVVVGGFLFFTAVRRRGPIQGDLASLALVLYVSVPYLFAPVPFPRDMSLASRIRVDFLQFALIFIVVSILTPPSPQATRK